MEFLSCPMQGFAGMSSKIPKSSSSSSLAFFPHGPCCSRWAKSETEKHTGKAAWRAMSTAPGGIPASPLSVGSSAKWKTLGNSEVQQVPDQCVGNEAVQSRIPKELQCLKSIFPFLVEFTPLAFHCVFLFLESTIKKENCSFLYFRNSDATPCFPSSLYLERVQ